jgi:hypothetical protein
VGYQALERSAWHRMTMPWLASSKGLPVPHRRAADALISYFLGGILGVPTIGKTNNQK